MITNLKSKSLFGLMLGLTVTFGCTQEEELAPNELLGQSTSQAAVGGDVNQGVRFSANRYLIVSSGTTLSADIKAQLKSLQGEIISEIDEVGIATVVSDDPAFAAKASKIKGVGSVIKDLDIQWHDLKNTRTVDIDAVNFTPPSTGDSNPFYTFQWGHTAIEAPAAWNAGARGKGARVAVLDSGFDLTHPDLRANIDLAASANFVPGEELQFRGAGLSHGTHVAGTIAAVDNNIGVIGVAPEATLIVVKVLRDGGSGSFSWMLSGIVHAVNQGADVINMSLGAGLPRNGKYLTEDGTVINDTKATQELITMINRVTTYATQKGVTVISSAGNDENNGNKDGNLMYIPAHSPNVISISATGPKAWAYNPLTTDLDRVASYTNYGTSDVDFAAPGGDFDYQGNEIINFRGIGQYVWALDMVLSTTAGGYSWSAGTSMASPHVSGVAALIIGQYGKMSPKQVEARLRASSEDLGKPGRDPFYGHGRVNAFRAVSAVQ